MWKVGNDAIFKDKSPSLHHMWWPALIMGFSRHIIWKNGCMRNSISDLLILRRLNIKGRVGKAPKIIEVQWLPPNPGWIKVNTDGSANGSPGPASCSCVFRTYRGFCKGCFSCPHWSGLCFRGWTFGYHHCLRLCQNNITRIIFGLKVPLILLNFCSRKVIPFVGNIGANRSMPLIISAK